MNKRFLTILLAIGFVSLVMGQVPMVVKGEMKNVGAMKSNGTVHMKANAPDVGVPASFGLLVNEGSIIFSDGLTLASNHVTDAMIFNDSTKSATISFPNSSTLHKNVQILKTFVTERVTYFSFPFDVALKDITWNASYGDCGARFDAGDWGIAWYNSEERAHSGDVQNHWKYFNGVEPFASSTAILEAGQAYMIGFDEDLTTLPTTITFTFPAMNGGTVDAIYANTHDTSVKFYYSSTWGQGYAGWNVLGHKNTSNFELYQFNMKIHDIMVNNPGDPTQVNSVAEGVYIHKPYALGFEIDGKKVEGYWKTIDTEDPEEDNKMSPYGVYFIQVGKNAAPHIPEGNVVGGIFHYNIGLGKSFETSDLRSTAAETTDALRLQLSFNGEVTDQLTVKQGTHYSNTYSLGEDNPKMFNRVFPEFYTILEDIPMAINRYRLITQDIPLGLALNKPGEYAIGINKLTGFENYNFYLVDHLDSKIYNLWDADYTFTSNAITDNTRYALRITSEPTTIVTQGDSNVLVYVTNNVAYVANLKVGDNVNIYDVAGKLISQNKAISSEVSYPLAGPGVYVIKVTGSQTAISKVINQVK